MLDEEAIVSPKGHRLEPIMVGKIRGSFWVPGYQRGYRWAVEDVQRLLDDIWDCKGRLYNLQPVVVKLRRKGADETSNEWELIDGQQRLTTLYLIMHYMKVKEWKKFGAPYSIQYATRPGSQDYLTSMAPELASKNIDFFHLYQAFEVIDKWFRNHGDVYVQEDVVSRFHGYLNNNVGVIWYEASDEDSIELFTRLNVGRISLTDAELVKAKLLSGVRMSPDNRAEEIAAQWDSIERDLYDPDVWAFITGLDDRDVLERYPTRISLLLDTLADSHAKLSTDHRIKALADHVELVKGKRPRYFTFDVLHKEVADDPFIFWDNVVELHALIQGWYSDPRIYNKIGFLAFSRFSFGKMVDWSKGKRKGDFDRLLRDSIRSEVLKAPKSKLLDLSYDRPGDHPKLQQILLLMNVVTTSRSGHRFPFRRHVGKQWSLEHIHAQNSEPLKKADEWSIWLRSHRQALQALGGYDALMGKIDVALDRLSTTSSFGDTFRALASEVVDAFKAPDSGVWDHKVHSISNLALLSSGNNSALSNAVFEVKRQRVLEMDRNEAQKEDAYIPICTRNVFLKYYTGADAQQVHFWSPQDRESYYSAIVQVIDEYLLPENEAKEEEAQ